MDGSEHEVSSSAHGSDVVALLDEVVAAARAHCGLVVVRSPGGLRELAARSDRRRDLALPIRYSRPVCERVFAEGKAVVQIDTGGIASRRWVVVGTHLPLHLVLIECVPVNRGGETIAVVYLEADAARPPAGESPRVQAAIVALAAVVAGPTADPA